MFFIGLQSCDPVIGLNKSANEILNNTFVKEEEEGSPNNCPLLNNTFSLDANESGSSQRNVTTLRRPGSTDSGGADDDQLSSASESSHTSSTRLMSVGDVQNLARLQEQSEYKHICLVLNCHVALMCFTPEQFLSYLNFKVFLLMVLSCELFRSGHFYTYTSTSSLS